VVWVVKLVSIGAEGEEHSTNVMWVARPDTLADLGTLSLSLAEGKQLLADVQREQSATNGNFSEIYSFFPGESVWLRLPLNLR